ncbi:membrane protease YdiL (CAAX protease family) [Lewinella marina]|nr:CPBP family intramembrane glutamic endopeptidase [Neolewinella marina]NJB84714.1 membrane protease YdiL (CAAX protease family) [Neolewinella marina]
MKILLWVIYALASTIVAAYLTNSLAANSRVAFAIAKILFLSPAIYMLCRNNNFKSTSAFASSDVKLAVIYFMFLTLFIVIALIKIEFDWRLSLLILAIIGTLIFVSFEELVFRGLPFSSLPEYGLRLYQHKYAILFGAAHFGNLLYNGNLMLAMNQVIIAYGLGMILSAVYLKYGSLLHVVALHFIVNITKEYDLLFDDDPIRIYSLAEISFEIHELVGFSFGLGLMCAAASYAILSREDINRLQAGRSIQSTN